MLFTEAGLEHATRLRVAAMHAGRFRDAGLRRIASGAGGEVGGASQAARAGDGRSIAAKHPTGIKLSPAIRLEAQWVSERGAVVELVLWSGQVARAGVGRAAFVLGADGAHELVARADTEDVPPRRLIGALAAAHGLGMIADRIAYLTSDSAIASPFAAGFRVREVLPLQEAKLRQALRARGIGVLEIKKRGVDLNPAALRSRLGLTGDDSATLVATRLGDRRVGILADRLSADVPSRPEREESAQ